MNKEELNSISSGSESELEDKFTTPPRTPFIEVEDPINSSNITIKQEDSKESTAQETASTSSTSTNKKLSSSSTNNNNDSTTDSLVEKLNNEILELSSQVTSLNSKLINGYTRLGDLEDELEEKNSKEFKLLNKLNELEKEKLEREKSIETGGWVERVSK